MSLAVWSPFPGGFSEVGDATIRQQFQKAQGNLRINLFPQLCHSSTVLNILSAIICLFILLHSCIILIILVTRFAVFMLNHLKIGEFSDYLTGKFWFESFDTY